MLNRNWLKIIVATGVFLIPWLEGFSQNKSTDSLSIRCNQLVPLFEQLRKTSDESLKIQLNHQIHTELSSLLQKEESMDFPFDTLKKYMGRVYSPDKKIRIFSWNIIDINLNYKYFGFLQIRGKGKIPYRLIELTDSIDLLKENQNTIFPLQEWYGGLVYKILQTRWERVDYYTIFLMDPKDIFSSRKILDVLWFDENQQAWWGKALFQNEKGKLQNRVVFEYSAQAVMNLKYEDRYQMIVYDHLSCFQPGMEGNYRFYGPDLSFDAYRWDKGFWKYLPDVDVKNEYRPRKSPVLPPVDKAN